MSLLLVKLARRLKLKVIFVGQRMLSELDKKEHNHPLMYLKGLKLKMFCLWSTFCNMVGFDGRLSGADSSSGFYSPSFFQVPVQDVEPQGLVGRLLMKHFKSTETPRGLRGTLRTITRKNTLLSSRRRRRKRPKQRATTTTPLKPRRGTRKQNPRRASQR